MNTLNDIHAQGAFIVNVEETDNGKRLDFFITERIESAQRSKINDLISNGSILVNESPKKPSYRVKPFDRITGIIPPLDAIYFEPENIPIDILYEDDDIIVINKQPSLVVHPAPGNWSGTLVNGLLFHYPEINKDENDFRPGIIHRLDKDTSGVMVVAKNQRSLLGLSGIFQSRQVKKEYITLVHGKLATHSGIIVKSIGRHPVERKKMSVLGNHGKSAETHYHVDKRFNLSTLVSCNIKTGRTHQIRVHMQSIGHPVVGDLVYGQIKNCIRNNRYQDECNALREAKRQMLHSYRLEIIHPRSQEIMVFEAPIPEDMSNILEKLEVYSDQFKQV